MRDHRPVTRTDVAAVEVDGEWVVYDPRTGDTAVLNPSAATIWAMLDGSVTAAEVSEEIAQAHGLEPAEVAAQVRELIGDLAERGLLVDDPSSEIR